MCEPEHNDTRQARAPPAVLRLPSNRAILQYARAVLDTIARCMPSAKATHPIVFDIDDTLITSFNDAAMPAMCELVRHVIEQEWKVILVTARTEGYRAETIGQLARLGIRVPAHRLLLRPDSVMDSASGNWKYATRQGIVRSAEFAGSLILMSFGDRAWDIATSKRAIPGLAGRRSALTALDYELEPPLVVRTPDDCTVIGIIVAIRNEPPDTTRGKPTRGESSLGEPASMSAATRRPAPLVPLAMAKPRSTSKSKHKSKPKSKTNSRRSS